jgi:uncharacterized coiled-coil DUF342 family protein
MSTQTRSEIEAELDRLEEEERAISAKRRRLHDRMDIWAGAAGAEGAAAANERRAEERELSERRRELHKRIRELRVRRDQAD